MSSKGAMTVRQMGRLGGRARAERYDSNTLGKWARRGGMARAKRHTAEELRGFARNAGRRPWKITPAVRRRILAMLAQGRRHQDIAAKFGISLRAIGRVVARQKQRGPSRKEGV